MSLEAKIEKLSQLFKEIKTTDDLSSKRKMIVQLRKLASQAMKLMQENEQPANTKRRRQIDDVLKKCETIEHEIAAQLPTFSKISNSKLEKPYKQSSVVQMAVRSVIMHEIRSSQIQVSPKEYELIYKRMCNNMEVMKEMEEMVKEQGENIDKVNDYIDSTYQNVQKANQELKEANELQKQTRRMKFKLAVSGFFAALGYKILGLPGLIGGLFFGTKATI